MKSIKNRIPKEEEYCLNCICSLIFQFASYLGLNYATGSCIHEKKSSVVRYHQSKIAMIACIFCQISILIVAISNIYQLLYDEEVRNKLDFIFKFGLVMFQLNLFIICLTQLVQRNEIVRERQGFAAIINNKHIYATEIMINKQNGIYFYRYTLFGIVLCIFTVCIITIMEFMYAKYNTFWDFSNVVASCIYMFCEILFCFLIVIKVKLYHHLLRGCYDQIKSVLNKRLECIQKEEKYSKSYYVSEPISRMNFSVTNIIQKKIRLHCALIKNLESYNSTLNPNIVFHLVMHIIVLTLNVYLIISIWLQQTSLGLLVLKEVETFCILMGALWVLLDVESLVDKGDIMEFLHTYPVHKLQVQEARQVDMLIQTLRIIRPALTGSGIIEIRLKILASVIATVLSYVLLALQFRASWLEE